MAWNISITFLLRWFLAAALIKSIIYNWNPIKFVFHGASLYQWVFFVRKLKPHVARIPLFPSRLPPLMAEARWPKHEIFVRCLLPALVFFLFFLCLLVNTGRVTQRNIYILIRTSLQWQCCCGIHQSIALPKKDDFFGYTFLSVYDGKEKLCSNAFKPRVVEKFCQLKWQVVSEKAFGNSYR